MPRFFFFFSSSRRHTRFDCDWSSDVCSSDLWQWNLTTETALWKNSKLELGWVANRGIHLQNAVDANQLPLADRLFAAQLAVTPDGTAGVANHANAITAMHPYPFPSPVGQITEWSHTGDSIYHS